MIPLHWTQAHVCVAAAGSGFLPGARVLSRVSLRPFGHGPRLPSPYRRLRFAGSAHDLGGPAALGRRRDDGGAPHVLLRRAEGRLASS